MAERVLDLDDPGSGEATDPRYQQRDRNRAQVIEIRDAAPRHPLAPPEDQLLRNHADLRRHLDGEDTVQILVCPVYASGWQSPAFTLPSARPIQVSADGKTHADKGFTVYVMNSDELDNFRSRTPFRHISALQGA